ncbi:MAG: conjugative transposon protein TraM [Bacteroidales bacterium]|nr:conjugative transposon protein TraM [Bacteroidales bacterium]
MDKKTMTIAVVALGVLLFGGLVWFLATEFGGKTEPVQEKSVTATIPDGEVQKMSDSKSEAFRGSVSTDAYFEQLGQKMKADEDISLVSSTDSEVLKPVAAQEPAGAPVERVFGPAPQTAPAPVRRSSGGNGPSSRTMTQQERLDYDRQRAEMVKEVLTGGDVTPGSDRGAGMADQVGHDGAPASIDLSTVGSSDGIITSLDDDFEDAAVQYEGAKRPFKCMFVRDQKLTSGQRVTLRLLEDYVEGGVRIPANTHLAAICKIGDRLELHVRSLEMNGRIVPLALDAYDTDGLQGIYCPETSSAKNSRKVREDAISTAGTTFGGLVGDLASTVIRTGASIARSASGEVSVNVVSGYEFYLVKSERK